MNEVFFVSTSKDKRYWNKVKRDFPFVRKIEKGNLSFSEIVARAQSLSMTQEFWIIYDEINLLPNFKCKHVIGEWDREYIHEYKVLTNRRINYGAVYQVSKLHKHPFEFKQIDLLAGISLKTFKSNYDIVFISYNESFADVNFQRLTDKNYGNQIFRINGVKGIHQAHLSAAELVSTDMFWVVDADADVVNSFKFNYEVRPWDLDKVHVWQSRNPLNNLEYGYGGVKLLPKKETLNMDVSSVDMTTSISSKFVSMPYVSNYTRFNTDEFSTWRSAFRECVKLSSKVIDDNPKNIARLDIWCSIADGDYAKSALAGAIAGRAYGQENAGNIPALSKINDFTWLQDRWQAERSQK